MAAVFFCAGAGRQSPAGRGRSAANAWQRRGDGGGFKMGECSLGRR